MRHRAMCGILACVVAGTACGGGSTATEETTSAPTPAQGVECTAEGEQTGTANGTLRCERDGDRLVWQLFKPESVHGDILGTPCATAGETTPMPEGTAVCVDENGTLVWRRIGGDIPGLPAGVECGSDSNPPNPLALPTDNANIRASLDAFPIECMRAGECAPTGDQAEYQWYRTDFNLAVDPRNPARLLVGVERLGVFESLDRGDTWQPLSEDGILHSLRSTDDTVCWTQTFQITFDPRVPGRIYLNHGGGGTIEAGTWQARGAGLYRSDDDGRTWQLLTTPDMNAYVAGFAIDPTSSDTLYMGTSSAPQTDGSAPVAYVDSGLLYRSDDAGRTWRELPTGWGARAGGLFVWVDPADPDIVLFGVFQPRDAAAGGAPTGTGLGPGWYRSADGGRTWAPHGVGEGAVATVGFMVTISPDGSTIVSMTGDELWTSIDGGATWVEADPPRWAPRIDPHGNGQRVYAILSAEYAGTDRDQFGVSNDGGRRWKVLGALPPEMRINEWNEPPLKRRATPSHIVVDPVDASIIYVTGAGGTIARSNDGGGTWVLLTTWETFPGSTVAFR